jgi:tRNA threonylcarbamoyladenosine biosynthesis protein TsaE
VITKSRDETIKLGEKIAKALKAGDVVALSGQLGAGKTTLIQGVARGLGIKNYITSPTFTLINEFKGRLSLYHVDLYRLNDIFEAEDIAIEEYFEKGGITVVEWAEKIKELLPKSAIKININVLGEEKRDIDIKGLKI